MLKELINRSDAVVIGAGSGLSSAAGLEYSGERFETLFQDYINKYNLTDMYTSGFYNFPTEEERWGYWCKHVYHNRFEPVALDLYLRLKELVKIKDYFIITTNVDHQFYKSGFDTDSIFPVQGDYGEFQCPIPCHNTVYENEAIIHEMVESLKDLKVSSELIPKCPKCGAVMDMHLRKDDTFIEDHKWKRNYELYEQFINKHKDSKVLFLELGVGYNTPGIIKYSFWQMTYRYDQSKYLCISKGQNYVPKEIKEKAIVIDDDISKIF